ncbi:MAG: ACT domain-containing protein [Candidatus Firestonebacteria bacterium]
MISCKVFLAIGHDRAGIISEVSLFLSQRNCNIEDSRMASIGEEFVLFLLFSGDHKDIKVVQKDISLLEKSSGLNILLKDTKPPVHKYESPPPLKVKVAKASLPGKHDIIGTSDKTQTRPYKVVAVGMDHPGIINEITTLLKKYNINIEDLKSSVTYAPVSGTPLFHLHIKMAVPITTPVKELKENLTKLEKLLNLNITLLP